MVSISKKRLNSIMPSSRTMMTGVLSRRSSSLITLAMSTLKLASVTEVSSIVRSPKTCDVRPTASLAVNLGPGQRPLTI